MKGNYNIEEQTTKNIELNLLLQKVLNNIPINEIEIQYIQEVITKLLQYNKYNNMKLFKLLIKVILSLFNSEQVAELAIIINTYSNYLIKERTALTITKQFLNLGITNNYYNILSTALKVLIKIATTSGNAIHYFEESILRQKLRKKKIEFSMPQEVEKSEIDYSSQLLSEYTDTCQQAISLFETKITEAVNNYKRI